MHAIHIELCYVSDTDSRLEEVVCASYEQPRSHKTVCTLF